MESIGVALGELYTG